MQQQFIEAVLNGLLWICCFAYLDDILTFSASFEDHIKHFEQILTRLRDHNLILQPSKCSFCRPTFEILRFVATKDGLSPNPKKVKAIKDYPLPRTPKEVSRFLGMTSWLRRFIPRLSALTANLRKAAQLDNKSFKLTKKAINEIKLLKEMLTDETCMASPPISQNQFYIHVDTSKTGLGAILTQLDENGNHQVVEYASHVLTETQRKYTNSVCEGLGILWSLNTFKYYIYRCDPIVYCDCSSFSDIINTTEHIPNHKMLCDWIARILQYNICVIHKPDKLMVIPDVLSHHYATYDTETETDEITNIFKDMVETAVKTGNSETNKSLDKQSDLLQRLDFLEEQNIYIPKIRIIENLGPDLLLLQEASTSRGGGHLFRRN